MHEMNLCVHSLKETVAKDLLYAVVDGPAFGHAAKVLDPCVDFLKLSLNLFLEFIRPSKQCLASSRHASRKMGKEGFLDALIRIFQISVLTSLPFHPLVDESLIQPALITRERVS